jgi:hypothetical protein
MSAQRGPDDPDGWVMGQGVQVGNDNTQFNIFGMPGPGADIPHGFRAPLTGRTRLHDPPSPVPDYVERDQWFKRVLSFLRGPGGYLVVEGPAGVGKSTFLAHLAESRGYPCAFIASELNDPRMAIVDLCDRLAERWRLPRRLTLGVQRAWEAAGGDVDQRLGVAVQVLLGEAAARGRGPVVLVVDGVTADDPHVHRILPRRLPSGVYIIIGQRPGGRATEGFEPRSVLTIKPSEQVTGELRRWVAETIRRDPLPEVLRRAGVAPGEFTDTLTRKAAGVWVYARYVLSDVELGTLDPSAIATIPAGLWRYFADYFTRWREGHPDTWASHDLPALAAIVAAREDLPVTRLASVLASADEMELETERLRGLLGQSWISFLSHPPQSDVYRCYHQSLRDFVAGNMAITDLTARERELQAEMQRALVRANRRLAKYYRDQLDSESSDKPEHRSALRALAAGHFAAVGDLDALDALLVRESHPVDRFGQRQRWRNDAYRGCERDGDVGGYLEIARAALGLAHQLNSTGSISSAETVRYALIGSSVISMAANLPTELLRAVLTHQLWAPREVLRHIEAVPETQQRARQLAEVLPDLTGPAFTDGAELLVEIGALEPIERFLGLMGRRLPELHDELLNRLLACLRTEALERLCPVLCRWMPSERLSLLLRQVLAVRYWDASCADIVHACGAASPSMCEVFVHEIAESALPESRKAMAIAPLITLLESDRRRIELATSAARQLSSRHAEYLGGREFFDPRGEDVAVAYGYLAPVLPGLLSGKDNYLPAEPSPRRWFRRPGPREDEALEPGIREDVLKNPELLARAHCIAASVALTDQERAGHARHAYEAAMAIQNSYTQGELLVRLCDIAGNHLDARACLNQVLHVHRKIRWVLLGHLLRWLSDDDCAIALDWATSGERPYLQAIKVLLPRLSQAQIQSLLSRTWPEDDTDHSILERQQLLLAAADETVIQRYLDASLPPAGSKIGWVATERLKAVCAAPRASREQVERCVQRLVDDYDPRSPYHGEVLVAALPGLSPQQVAGVVEKVGLLAGSSFHDRRRVLIAIAETLPAIKLSAVVAAARAERDGKRQDIIGSIAQRLPRDLLDEAVDVVRQIGDDWEWSDVVFSIIPHATTEVWRQVAAITWPFRPDAPDGQRSVFHAASSRLPAADLLDMLEALQQEITGEAGERQRFQASRVLLAALQSGFAEVAAVCAQLAAEYGLLADSTVVGAILDCADQDTRQQVVELVWKAAHQPEGAQAPGRLECLTAILGFISAERVLAVAKMVSSTAEYRDKVSLLLGLADAWPEDQLDAIEMLVPPAKGTANSNDPYCTALRAVASRCSGDLRQELFDEILSRLGQRAAGHRNESIPDEVVREASPNAVRRLRTALLEQLEQGERPPDHLLAILAAKLSVTEALTAVRDTLESSAAPVHEDARRLVAGLVGRADERTTQDLLELLVGIEDHQSRSDLLAALAPALSPKQARRALPSLEEILPSSPRSLPGQTGPALADVTARHALALRLDQAERAPIVDAILHAAANNQPEWPDFLWGTGLFGMDVPTVPGWAADLVPRLLPDASPNGRELALVVARQLHDEAAAAVFLAVAANSATSEARAAALESAVDRIGRIRSDAAKARLLGAAARASEGAEAKRLFAEALMAAEGCASFGNDQCTALLDLVQVAPPGARADVLARAIMSYDSWRGFGDRDALLLRIIGALGELSSPACDQVAAAVAYGCRDKPRADLLSRLAIVGMGASRSLGPDWADEVVLSLTQVRSWWP